MPTPAAVRRAGCAPPRRSLCAQAQPALLRPPRRQQHPDARVGERREVLVDERDDGSSFEDDVVGFGLVERRRQRGREPRQPAEAAQHLFDRGGAERHVAVPHLRRRYEQARVVEILREELDRPIVTAVGLPHPQAQANSSQRRRARRNPLDNGSLERAQLLHIDGSRQPRVRLSERVQPRLWDRAAPRTTHEQARAGVDEPTPHERVDLGREASSGRALRRDRRVRAKRSDQIAVTGRGHRPPPRTGTPILSDRQGGNEPSRLDEDTSGTVNQVVEVERDRSRATRSHGRPSWRASYTTTKSAPERRASSRCGG